jgi:hypothetical protein
MLLPETLIYLLLLLKSEVSEKRMKGTFYKVCSIKKYDIKD